MQEDDDPLAAPELEALDLAPPAEDPEPGEIPPSPEPALPARATLDLGFVPAPASLPRLDEVLRARPVLGLGLAAAGPFADAATFAVDPDPGMGAKSGGAGGGGGERQQRRRRRREEGSEGEDGRRSRGIGRSSQQKHGKERQRGRDREGARGAEARGGEDLDALGAKEKKKRREKRDSRERRHSGKRRSPECGGSASPGPGVKRSRVGFVAGVGSSRGAGAAGGGAGGGPAAGEAALGVSAADVPDALRNKLRAMLARGR